MKKLLALVLTLCTLLCLYPVAVSAEEAPELDAEAGSYLDLYVKDGLVALFTAYDGVASEEEATTWTPVDFYGKTGYNSYVDPTTYEATLSRGNLYGWKWENGYLAHYAHTYSSNNRGEDAGSLMNLDALGALLLTSTASTLTVQEVFQFGAPAKEAEKAIPNVNENVVTNASALASTDYKALSMGSVVGNANLRLYQYYGKLDANKNILGSYIFGGTMASGYRNYFFGNEYWIGSNASLSGLTGNDGTSYSGYLVGTTAWGIVESSIIRKSDTDYTVHYHFAPSHENTWGAGKNLTPSVASGSATDLKLFVSLPANVFSVRIYNDVLTEDEINQNHLADLCGYYGVDVSKFVAMSNDDIATVTATTKDFKIARNASEFDDIKAKLEGIIFDVVNREALEAERMARLDLYVKDGLVALFSAYDGIAGAEKVWTAENLYGKEGYEDYVDPTTYTTTLDAGWTLQWKWEDGYLSHYAHPGVDSRHDGMPSYDASYFDLSALAPSFIKGADSKYTVQQVWQVVGTEAKEGYDFPIVVDGVVTNYSTLVSSQYAAYTGGSVIGDFKNTFVFLPKNDTPKPTLGSLFMQYSGSSYNHFFLTEYYTGQTGPQSLKDDAGNDISAWIMPKEFGVFESTTIANGDGTYTLSYQNRASHWQGNGFDQTDGFVFEGAATYTGSTTVNLFKTLASRVYSVRIYNRDLSAAEIAQNHFADLVNFYEVNVPTDLFELLTTEEIAAMYEAAADVSIARTLDDVDFIEGTYELMMVIIDAMSVITEEAESIVSFGGVAYRTSGDYGVRALFSVDKEAIASLESRGYTVAAYGAIVGVGENGGNVVNESAEALTVKLDEETGKVVLDTGKGKIVSTDAEGSFKHLTDDNVSFALSTTYAADGSNSQYYSTTLIYRAFTVITMDGEWAVLYDDVTLGETEDAISLVSVHEYALTDTTGMTPELIERLEAVLPADEE